ncbi:MFS transporter [Periweissella cryptocerci]|nr:MFS transporter [Periweissella cryptocerci]
MKSISLKRMIPGLVTGAGTWLGPYIVAVSIFLPLKIQALDAPHKVALVAVFSSIAMVIATIANLFAGALSDKTKSRFGKRTPWFVIGGLASMLLLMGAAWAPSIAILLVFWSLYQVTLNMSVASVGVLMEYTDKEQRGSASSAYGIGMSIGNYAFPILGAMFMKNITLGFIVFGLIAGVGGILTALIIKEPSNKNVVDSPVEKKEKKSFKELLKLMPGVKEGRDFYLALGGKLLFGIGQFLVVSYQMFILTDYMKLSEKTTQDTIQLISAVMMVAAIVVGGLVGPLADKIKSIKLPTSVAAILLGIGAIFPFFAAKPWTMIVFAIIGGIGIGSWNGIDQSLNVTVGEALDKERLGFFMGVYNLGNTLCQAAAPIIAAALISTLGFQMIFPFATIFAIAGGVLILMIKSVK